MSQNLNNLVVIYRLIYSQEINNYSLGIIRLILDYWYQSIFEYLSNDISIIILIYTSIYLSMILPIPLTYILATPAQ